MARVSLSRTYPKGNQKLAACEERGMKMPQVTGVLPETRRSSLGQGEADCMIGGGLKRCYVHVFL